MSSDGLVFISQPYGKQIDCRLAWTSGQSGGLIPRRSRELCDRRVAPVEGEASKDPTDC